MSQDNEVKKTQTIPEVSKETFIKLMNIAGLSEEDQEKVFESVEDKEKRD